MAQPEEPTPRHNPSEAKYAALLQALAGEGKLAVAFSGGVDSTLLLAAAREARGDRLLAVTVVSAFQPAGETEAAQALARDLGTRLRLLELDVLADHKIRANPPDRCYLCKRRIFTALLDVVRAAGITEVVEGSNVDDAADYRPGERAVAELGVRSPLREAGLRKSEIRQLARSRGLANWDKPALACLASRIPYSEELTRSRLLRVDRAEGLLRAAGFGQVRVRDHGNLARIEVPPDDIPRLCERARSDTILSASLSDAGYSYVTVDIEGYRTGAMNEVLPKEPTSE